MARNKNNLVQTLALALSVAVFGVSFDAFWHLSLGRESLFILPHLFIYAGALVAMSLALQGWLRFKTVEWKWVFGLLLAIPASGVLDEIWHQVNGKELLTSPAIVWSPPHALLFLSAMTVVMLAAFMVRNLDGYKPKNWLAPALLGMFLNLLVIFLGPLLPTGPHHLLGMTGAGVVSAAVIYVLILSRKLFKGDGNALIAAFTFILLQSVLYDSNYYISGDNFLHIPVWMNVLTYFVPALFIDSTDSLGGMTRGMFAGLAMGAVFFVLGGMMLPGNNLTYNDLWMGILSSAVGGLIAGLFHEYLEIRQQQE